MSDVAAHPEVRRSVPAIAEALEASASPQLRNMASIGGNLLQRTRCPYFRAETQLACNKRLPGSGCAAREGENRTAAIFGWSDACVATHPSDFAVALAALDGIVVASGPGGERAIPVVDFYRLPEMTAQRDTILEHGELIVAVEIPLSPLAERSRYLKLRERSSYEFALVSAAAAVRAGNDGRIAEARIALGGVAPKPWRLALAEPALRGAELDDRALRDALAPAFADAHPLARNRFKVELALRAAVRVLRMAGGEG